MTSEQHPFETAGYGPGPYEEKGMIEDSCCGLVCDNCGKKGLRWKFKLLSSTDQLFGVGSECIKKADPEQWLLMKHKYGAKSNITTTAVERREAYDTANALFNEYKRLLPNSWYLKEFKCGLEFDQVSRCHAATFEKEAENLSKKIQAEQQAAARNAEREEKLVQMMREIGEIYAFRLRTNTVPR